MDYPAPLRANLRNQSGAGHSAEAAYHSAKTCHKMSWADKEAKRPHPPSSAVEASRESLRSKDKVTVLTGIEEASSSDHVELRGQRKLAKLAAVTGCKATHSSAKGRASESEDTIVTANRCDNLPEDLLASSVAHEPSFLVFDSTTNRNQQQTQQQEAYAGTPGADSERASALSFSLLGQTQPDVAADIAAGDLAATDEVAQANLSVVDEETGAQITSSERTQQESLLEATPVDDLDLPQAQQVDVALAAKKRRQALWKAFGFVAIGTLFLVGIMILLVFLLRGSGSSTDVINENETNVSWTAPTLLELEEYVRVLLPNYTKAALDDPDSPQKNAFEWLMNDPALPNYTDWRILQRFILATFYHAMAGDSWFNNTNWLNYSVHECLWFGRRHYISDYDAFLYGNITFVNVELATACEEDPRNISRGKYRHLWLWRNNLRGTLPPELFALSSLRSISLISSDFIAGTLPSVSIGQASSLEGLAITNTGLGGSIPSEIGMLHAHLSTIYLIENSLTGTLPTELGLLSQLNFIGLAANVSV
jgi:hypothetical protein